MAVTTIVRIPIADFLSTWRRTMPGRIVLVANIPEEPHLIPTRKQCETQRMDRRITISFIEEAPTLVQMLEIPSIPLAPPERQTPDLKIAEELAIIVLHAIIWVKQPIDIRIGAHQLRKPTHKVARDAPQACEAARVIEDRHVKPVHEIVLGEEAERVVRDVAEEMYVGLNAPVEIVGCERRVLVEESGLPPNHRVVA